MEDFNYAGDLLTTLDTQAIAWDDNGNLKQINDGSPDTYSFNWDKRLREATVNGITVKLKYDPDSNRIYKESNNGQTNTKRKYIVGDVGGLPVILLEIDPDNNNEIVKSYVYAQDDLNAQYNGPQDSGDKYFYICDRLGNVRQVIDVNASVQYLYTYGPFGKVLESDEDADPPGNPFQFTGQYYDADLNQYYLRARQYSPDLARFTARDSYPGQFNEPFTLHAYLYCLDDPINRTDLTGEFSVLETTATVAKVGFMAWNVYSTTQSIKQMVEDFSNDVSAIHIMKGIIIDAAMNYGAGKALKIIAGGAKALFRTGKKFANKWKMNKVGKMGKQGEEAAGIVKNTEHIDSYTGAKKYRVPDELDHNNKILREVKNRKSLDFDTQIQDDLYYCLDNDYEFILTVRKDTVLSGPLKRAIDAGYITLEYLP